MSLEPGMVGPAGAGGLAALALAGWRFGLARRQRHPTDRERQQREDAADQAVAEALAREQARRTVLLAGSAALRPAAEHWSRGEGVGQIAYAVAGTAGANQLPDILQEHVRTGTADYVGPIFVAEPDVASRAAFVQRLPPGFRDRVVEVAFPLLPAGLFGRTVSEAQSIDSHWRVDLDQRLDTWLRRLRLDAHVVALYLFVSPGGSGALGMPIIERFTAEYDLAPVYVVMVLDHKADRRELNLPDLLDLYDTALVSGFLIGDNRIDAALFDQGLAYLFPAMIASGWLDPTPQSGFNVLPDVFRMHRVATIRVWSGFLPITYLPAFHSLPEGYYTDGAFAEIQAVRGVTAVTTAGGFQALPLTPAPRPHFLYVAAPVRPAPDLREIADHTRARMKKRLNPDVSLAFASAGYPLTPTSQEAPLVVVSLFPVLEGIAGIKQLVSGEAGAPRSRPLAASELALSRNGATRAGRA